MLNLLWLGCSTGEEPTPTTKPPDVLLVVLDTVRADAVGPYGSANATPALERLAQSAVVFEDVTSSSWTWPSHASLFTGEPPWVHGAHFTDSGGVDIADGFLHVSAMREDLVTLPERFSAAGYRTVLLSGNKLLAPELGLSADFETAEVFYDRDDQVLERAEALFAEEDPRPLLLVVNLYIAHGPWGVQQDTEELRPRIAAAEWAAPWRVADTAIAPHMGRTRDGGDLAEMWLQGALEIPDEGWALVRELYEGEVRQADRELAFLLGQWFGSRGPDGIVAVTSDHGEYLSEHGMVLHCRTVYPEVNRVPLLISAPTLTKGSRVSTPVHLREVHDALLQLAGLEDSSRLVDAASGATRPMPITARSWRDRGWAESVGGVFAVGYRLYRDHGEALVLGDDGRAELYDLGADPWMRADLASERPERVRALTSVAEGAFPESASSPLQIDAETRQRLEEMGYLTPGDTPD